MTHLRNLAIIGSLMAVVSCSKSGPLEIAVGKDQCENCKMNITEPKYATQLVTAKGKVYKFDDLKCMQDYATSNTEASKDAKTYVADFPSGQFFDSSTATFIQGGSIKSPMGGNTQAYKDKAAAQKAATELGATLTQ